MPSEVARAAIRNCALHFARPRGAVEQSETGASEIMAELRGESSNLFEDIFAELENWEALLESLPDFDGDDYPDDPSPPDLAPDI